jgi:hypothetical protein
VAAPDPTVYGATADPRPRPTDLLVSALARYVEALNQCYPDGPDQMRRKVLDARVNMPRMRKSGRGRAA